MFTNLKELIESMPTEEICREYLAKQRWDDGKAICVYCGHEKCYVVENKRRYKCAKCKIKFAVTVGTIFESSNVPLSKWFMAVYLLASHKKGISSYQLGKDIGVSQKSAWFMLHRVRELMRLKKPVILEKVVEIDESYIGGKVTNMSKSRRKKLREEKRTYSTKNMVIGLLQRDGQLTLKAMGKNNDGSVLRPVVIENVDKDALIITDGLHSYDGLDKHFKGHEIVHHKEQEYVRGQFHTNSIEGAFSLLKRSILGIYHQTSPQHLTRYCDETMYRYNTRKLKDAERFSLSLQQCAGRLDYKTLTTKPVIYEETKTVHKKGEKRPIVQCLNGQFIAQFSSMAEAEKTTGVKAHSIWKVLHGKRGTSGCFEWYYA